MIATILNISEDIWAEGPVTKVDIHQLQMKDFAKWVRKQVRLFGRKADICNQQYSAVEIWLHELGIDAGFLAGGEVSYEGEYLFSDWQACGYYMFNEDGRMETSAGRWLQIVEWDNQEDYLIGR